MARLSMRLRLFAALAVIGSVPLLLLSVFGLPLAVLLLLPLVVAVAYPVAAFLARPLEELLQTAGRIREGDRQARALLEPGTEWAALGGALFELAAQLEQLTRGMEATIASRTAVLARKADQLRAVGQVGQQVAAVLEPDALLHFVARVMRGTFGYDVVAVLLRHEEHLVLSACAARGVEEPPTGRVFPVVGPGAPSFSGALISDGAVLDDALSLVPAVPVVTSLAVPIRLGDRALGLLAVQHGRGGALDEEDLFAARTIAGQVAVALENARLLEAERRLRRLSVSEERNRMAREIHDTLAQGFMGILMHLRAMQVAVDPEQARRHREEAEALAQESLQEARRSVWNLRPRLLEGEGLAKAIRAELSRLEHRAGFQAELRTQGPLEQAPPVVEDALLRIAQEALHNVAKYAQASTVQVHLVVGDGRVDLAILDDGLGFQPESVRPRAEQGGYGLQVMRERAELLGGRLTVTSAPGAGCKVSVRIPLTLEGGVGHLH